MVWHLPGADRRQLLYGRPIARHCIITINPLLSAALSMFQAMHFGFAVKYLNETRLSHKYNRRKLQRSHVNDKFVSLSILQ